MSDNPMLTSDAKREAYAERRNDRARQAYELLVLEFFEGLANPLERISVLGSEQDARSLVDVVLDLLCDEDDSRTLLSGMLLVLRDHANTLSSSAVLRALAARFANSQVTALCEQGAFDED